MPVPEMLKGTKVLELTLIVVNENITVCPSDTDPVLGFLDRVYVSLVLREKSSCMLTVGWGEGSAPQAVRITKNSAINPHLKFIIRPPK
jgi:hypothetical protein